MNILFLGNFRVDYCSEVHYKKTLEKMGHKVTQMQESEVTGEDIMMAAVICAKTPGGAIDIFLWVHTHGWATRNMQHALRFFAGVDIPTVGYHLDLYMGLQRQPQMDEYVTKLNHFFTVDKLMADWLNDNTTTKGHYLPAGVFEDECYMAQPDFRKYPQEIIFTGSLGYHPEYPYRQQLIGWLKKTYGSMFAHYGGGGKNGLRGSDLNALYASASVVIGDTLCKDFTYPYYFSDRLFEVPGRGGFMIFPNIKGLEFMFELEKEMVTYQLGNFSQLKSLIDYFVEHDEERNAIRLAAHNRVKETHTYRHRLMQLLETLQQVAV